MGKNNSVTVGFKYYLGSHLVVCQSPIDDVLAIKFQDKIAWEGVAADTKINIHKPNLFGGEGKEGGVSGTVDVALGSSTQVPNTYLQNVLDTAIPAFRGVVSLFFNKIWIGNNPFLKPVKVKVKNVYSTFGDWYPEKAGINAAIDYEGMFLYLALDASGSMFPPHSDRMDTLKPAVKNFLESLKGSSVSLRIVAFGAAASATEILNCTDADYDTLKTWVDGIANLGGTDYGVAVASAPAFFAQAPAAADAVINSVIDQSILESSTGDSASHDFANQKALFFITDGEPTEGTFDAAQVTLATIPDVDVYCFNIDLADTTYTAQMDNTPGDGVPIVSGSNPDDITSSFSNALSIWLDLNPAHILRDHIISPSSNGTGDASEIGDSFAAVADTLFTERFGLSLFNASPRSKEDFKKTIEAHIDGHVYFDRVTGKWEIKLVRDDYDVGSLHTFDKSNVSEWLDGELPLQEDLPNQITVTYTSRDDGEPASLTITNVAAVQQLGVVIPDKRDYPGITWPDLAGRVALRDLAALTTPLRTGAFYALWAPTDMNVGTAFVLNLPDLGIHSVVCRVTEVKEGDGRDNKVMLRFLEDKFAIEDSSIVGRDEPPEASRAALPSNARLVQEMPYYTAVMQSDQTGVDDRLTDNPDYGRLIATCDKPSNMHFNATIAEPSGAEWESKGTAEFSAYSTLNADLSKTATSFDLALTASLYEIAPGEICLIGTEFMRVDDLVDNTTHITVTVGRGCLDTVPVAHVVGGAVLFWVTSYGTDNIEYTAGQSVDVKLLPRTSQETLAPSAADTDTVVMDSRMIRPYPPGDVTVDGAYTDDRDFDGSVDLAWVHRDRTLQTTTTPEDFFDPDIGPEAGVTYTVRVKEYDADDVLISTLVDTDVGTASSYTYTTPVPSDAAATLDFEVVAIRDGYECWQIPTVKMLIPAIIYDMAGAPIADMAGTVVKDMTA